MKHFYNVFLILLLAFSLVFAADGKSVKKHKHNHSHFSCIDDMDIDFEEGTLIFRSHDYDETVEITEECELYVNGRKINLNDSERKMVRKYYYQYCDLLDYATEIGIEGARIGVKGAEIGVIAVAGVLKAFFTDYDCDELEEDLERKAERIEAKAEKLEQKAEKLEDFADDLEELHYELRDEISALQNLAWF